MKKTVLLFWVLGFAGMVAGQEKLPDVHLAVQQSVVSVFDAISNRDSTGLKKYCSPDILLFEYGMTWTIDSLIRRVITENPSTDFKRSNKLEFINTEVSGNNAWATYRLKSDITRNGKAFFIEWLETVVLVKDKEVWRVKILHSSLVKRS